jgi:hypothetical protein
MKCSLCAGGVISSVITLFFILSRYIQIIKFI